MIRLKDGVSLDRVDRHVFHAVAIADEIWARHGAAECWVTAGNEPGHKTNLDRSRQFHRLPDGTCQAADLRTHNLPPANVKPAVDELARTLGPLYDVLLEHPGEPIEHCHLQFDPDRPGTVT